jgi:hypothetical protein
MGVINLYQTPQQLRITGGFAQFVLQWGEEYNHWKKHGQLEVHERNLEVAIDNYKRLMAEHEPNTENSPGGNNERNG